MQNKAFSTIGIVIILIILISGGYFAWQYLGGQKEEVGAPEEMAEDETADWETYSNPEANFTFDYPNDWEIREEYFYKDNPNLTVVVCRKEEPTRVIANCIQINMPQFPCETRTEIEENWIGICVEDLEALEAYEKVVNSFKVEKRPEIKMPEMKAQEQCGGVIEWAKILDLNNDRKKELIISCSSPDKIFIFKWEEEKFILWGGIPKEIEVNPWNIYIVNPNDFGSIYTSGKIEFNMAYSPSGGVPQESGNEETIWVRINTYEWDDASEQLQFKIRRSLFGGSAWYTGDLNNDGKDELVFFARTDSEELKGDYSIRIMSWDGEKFALIGETNVSGWMSISYPESGIQPSPGPQDFMFIADTNNNGKKEIILLDIVGVQKPYQYLYLALEQSDGDFVRFRMDEEMKGKSPQYSTTQYKIKGIGDFNGDGENELITQLLPQESEEFHLAVFKWNEGENIYEEILGKILSGYDFLAIGDADNDGMNELIFQDKENNLTLFSYEEISEKTVVYGWGVYENEKFQYIIDYPEEVFSQIPEPLVDNVYFYVSHEDSILVDDQAYVRIQIGQNPELLGLEDWVYSSYNSELKKAGWCIQEFGNVLRLTSSCDYHTWEWKHELISSGERVVIISTIGTSEKTSLFEVSEKMLSTFRFLE